MVIIVQQIHTILSSKNTIARLEHTGKVNKAQLKVIVVRVQLVIIVKLQVLCQQFVLLELLELPLVQKLLISQRLLL